MKRTLAARWFASGLTILSAWACSANSNNGVSGGLGSGSTTGSGSTGNGGAGNGGGSNGTGGLILGGTGASTSNGGASADGACPKVYATPEAIEVPTTVPITVPITTTVRSPLDMYIMYDQSGSMGQGSPEKWTAIKDALIGFVNSPQSADVGIGIQYFPLDPPACSSPSPTCDCIGICPGFLCACWSSGGGSCDVSLYAQPDVPITVLPGGAQAIINSVNAHGPGGGTPTRPALEGALQYASAHAATNPMRNGLPVKTVVVLATDGDPTGCTSNSVGDVANVAGAAFGATPSIPTFVIGVGSSLTSLNSIAASGGTTQAIIVDTSADPTQQFLDAMNSIRDTSTVTGSTTVYVDGGTTTVYSKLPCEWTIPPVPPAAGTFDKSKVNVTMNSATVGFVQDPASCTTGTDAWHYDDYANPTKVMLCPATCDTVKAADASAQPNIEVYFGCQTEILFQ